MLERLTHGRAISSDVVKALREWIQYKSQRNERYKEAGMTALITQAVNNSARYGAQAVIDTINNSMASGYKGIIWDRLKRPPTKRFNNATERNYDMDALEKRLLATN